MDRSSPTCRWTKMLPVELQRLEWERQQAELAARVITQDDAAWLQHPGGWQAGLTLVAGMDISFFPAAAAADTGGGRGGGGSGGSSSGEAQPAQSTAPAGTAARGAGDTQPQQQQQQLKESAERAVAALAVLTFPALQLRHLEVAELALGAPYLPGFLAFREVPAYLELLRRAAAAGVHPQLLLVDGFGALHPRRCGSASHLGVLSGLPTVGVAKNLLHVEGLLLDQKQARTSAADALAAAQGAAAAAVAAGGEPLPTCKTTPEGNGSRRSRSSHFTAPSSTAASTVLVCSWLPLDGAGGEVLGAALCGAGGSSRPVYVSVGHRVSLATAVHIVQRCCRHRVPEPIRQADLLSRAEVRRCLQQQPQQQQPQQQQQLSAQQA